MPNSKAINNKKIAIVMIAILGIAGLMSLVTKKVYAQDSSSPAAVEASVANVSASEENSGINRIIPSTKDWNGKHDINAKDFLISQLNWK